MARLLGAAEEVAFIFKRIWCRGVACYALCASSKKINHRGKEHEETNFVLWLFVLDRKRAILIDQFPVHKNFRIFTQIANHVPVHGAFVLAAGFRVAGPQRHME